MIKGASFKKYIQDQKEYFSVREFYEHFNFDCREEAESALKTVLKGLKKKADDDKQLHELIMRIEKDDYESLKEAHIEMHWAKKQYSFKLLEETYMKNIYQANVTIQSYDQLIDELKAKKKRKLN
ncbi:hypothetical protein BD770DRAFT_415301 [Pilaira anomala]|nr:hypothetical protein BD770DRAFT_415301 [Pilaira anomala]